MKILSWRSPLRFSCLWRKRSIFLCLKFSIAVKGRKIRIEALYLYIVYWQCFYHIHICVSKWVPPELSALEIAWQHEDRCILTFTNFTSISLRNRRRYKSQESGVNVSSQDSCFHFALSWKRYQRFREIRITGSVERLLLSRPSFLKFYRLLLFHLTR